MEEKNQSGAIPEHNSGKIIDSEKSIELPGTEEAVALFQVAKERLLDVNHWHQLTGAPSARFQVVDHAGHEVSRPVVKGDFFKINIPGPGSVSGGGYDWVRVEEVNDVSHGDTESIGIRVRPTSNPQSEDEHIAHFYSEKSTSNFTVTREGTKVTAGIYDRNTKPNEEGNLLDKARNLVVGLSAVAGFSKIQWEQLAEGLLRR